LKSILGIEIHFVPRRSIGFNRIDFEVLKHPEKELKMCPCNSLWHVVAEMAFVFFLNGILLHPDIIQSWQSVDVNLPKAAARPRPTSLLVARFRDSLHGPAAQSRFFHRFKFFV